MKVLFLTNVPSPYRVEFFNELGKHCELTVLFEKRISDERDDSWMDYEFRSFNGVFLKGKSVDTDKAFCLEVLNYVKDKTFDRIICADISSPTGMLAIQYMKMHKIRYYIEADGGMAKSGEGIKKAIKKHFIGGAKGYFSTSRLCDDYFAAYGAKPASIHRYPFTSLREDDLFQTVATRAEKEALRKQLGIEEKCVVLSVGRFSYLNGYGKGYDVLLKAAAQMPSSIGWYIVGGQPTEEFVKMKSDMHLSNVHFVDFKSKEALRGYYRASDIFTLMTVGDVWGLVINEAMACGLPVITTNRCVAGVELVSNEVNGYVIDVGDCDGLVRCVMQVFDGDMERMGKNALATIAPYTIENLAMVHMKILEKH